MSHPLGQRAVPVLVSYDISATETFYQSKMGFITVSREYNYLIMRRDTLELHFNLMDRGIEATSITCTIYVDDIESLYEEYRSVGLIFRGKMVKPDEPILEFNIIDDDGNMIRVRKTRQK